jgi:hypothetical protein
MRTTLRCSNIRGSPFIDQKPAALLFDSNHSNTDKKLRWGGLVPHHAGKLSRSEVTVEELVDAWEKLDVLGRSQNVVSRNGRVTLIVFDGPMRGIP